MDETQTKEQVLAIDGDTLAYRTAAVCEDHFEGAAFAIVRSTLKDIVTDTGVTKVRIYLSGQDNYRYKVAKTKPYKGNRATMVRPKYLEATREFLVEFCNAIVVNGYEADDAIATDMVVNGAIHVGVDKDMFQIAGRHYNYVKKEWIEVSPDQAILNLYRQILMGDTSDNIPGLPKVGEKKAFNAIQNPETAEEDAMEMYKSVVGLSLPGVNWIEYMAEQQSLVKMVTDVELDFDKFYEVEPETEGFTGQDAPAETTEEPREKLEVKL